MKKFIIIIVSLIISPVVAQSIDNDTKIDLNVLFVGYDPAKPYPETLAKSLEGNTSEYAKQLKSDYETRTPAFKSLLSQWFSNVNCVDARDYKQEMSASYDVTIFDQSPTPTKKEVKIKDEEGHVITKRFNGYLTEEYDHATIAIGKTAPEIGMSLGLKLDWKCHCLGADAFNVDTAHQIFNHPNKVTIPFKEKKVRNSLYLFPNSFNIPKKIPMWRVQKTGFEDSNYMPGMISRGAGFLDSPDTEYISGGVSTKAYNDVAMGRHGNFFMWGFYGAPDYMTEEARLVFINTVVYMSQFKGAKPVARKYEASIPIRDFYVDVKIDEVSKERYEFDIKKMEARNKITIQNREKVEALKAKGEELSRRQKMILKIKPTQIPTYEEYLKDKMGDLHEKFGTDVDAYCKYFNDYREYYYNVSKVYRNNLVLDKDAMALGIANRDIAILEKCVSLLKKKKDTALAKRILNRYTTENFETTIEWKKWLKANRNKLFFSDAGGYKWYVNTLK